MTDSKNPSWGAAQALQEMVHKVEASLQEAIQEFVSSDEFSPSDGLDFLHVKNSLMLSYCIELTNHVRHQLSNNTNNKTSLKRLTVMKTILEKSRGLEKKLRYQIDKLLAAGSNATTFVASEAEDPLQFRPDTSALQDDDDKEEEKQEEDGESSKDDSENDDDEDEDESDVDEDLRAAQMTVAASREKKLKSGKTSKGKGKSQYDGSDDGEEAADKDDGVYRAPRLAAVPYNLDKEDRNAERQKRQLKRMRVSELAQALRAQYREAPEQDDIHGGSELGKQSASARRFAEQQRAKEHYEEDAMVRLVTTREEKKQRNRILRQESSNLSAIADLGNIVRDAALVEDSNNSKHNKRDRSNKPSSSGIFPATERYHNGKRKLTMIDAEGRIVDKGNRQQKISAKNSLQAALFGSEGKKSKKKKRS